MPSPRPQSDRPTTPGGNSPQSGLQDNRRDDETAKHRAERVSLGYLPRGGLFWRIFHLPAFLRQYTKTGDYVGRWRDGLTLLALLIAVPIGCIVVLWEIFGTLSGAAPQESFVRRIVHQTVSPGTLASVHSFLDDNCQACHVPYHPIQDGHWAPNLLPVDDLSSNARCTVCHEGPPHHHNEKVQREMACAACHLEHLGREHRMTRVADARCLKCHTSLAEHMKELKPSEPSERLHISGFSADNHPEFAALQPGKPDPATLKFNHYTHLALGMPTEKSKHGFFKYGDIRDDKERKRYKPNEATSDDVLVHLRCDACHQLDRGDLTREPADYIAPRAPGAYYLPIVFENHCQACHPLELPVNLTRDAINSSLAAQAEANESRSVEASETISIRHGLTPDELDDYLSSQFHARREVQDSGAKLRAPRFPHKSGHTLIDAAMQAVENDVRLGREILFVGKQTCQKCHEYTGAGANHNEDSSEVASPDAILSALDRGELGIEKTNVPEIWFPKARFSHVAHRAYQCAKCHEGIEQSEFTADINLPRIATCSECHGPVSYAGGRQQGGVRYGCADCHNYHLADDPLRGRGSLTFAPSPPPSAQMTKDQ